MSRSHQDRIRIRRCVLDAIEAHAARESPLECCGVLLGRGREIHRAEPVRNLERDPARFDGDPLELIRAERKASRAEMSVLGHYHSHPSGDPLPSRIDRASVPWPDLPPYYHLIISPGRGWAAYCTRDGAWSKVEVEVTDTLESTEDDLG